jgi:hypothetical protein
MKSNQKIGTFGFSRRSAYGGLNRLRNQPGYCVIMLERASAESFDIGTLS